MSVSNVTFVVKATVTDPDPGALITITVQVTDGTNTYTFTGPAVPSGSVASVTASNLPTGLTVLTPASYTWKAQACQGTQCSAFVSHGGTPPFLAPSTTSPPASTAPLPHPLPPLPPST